MKSMLKRLVVGGAKFAAAVLFAAIAVTVITGASSYVAGTIPAGMSQGMRTFFVAELAAIDTALDEVAAGTALGTGSVTSTHVLDGTLLNADVNSSAAITYSKLLFSNNIVAGDIQTDAVGAAETADDSADRAAIDMVTVWHLGTPATASTIVVLNAATAAAASGTAIVGDITDPDMPRNLTITWHDGDEALTGAVVTVTGTDYSGTSVEETFALAAFASGLATTTGTKIFANVVSITWASAADYGGGETLSVGRGNTIGLPYLATDAAIKHVFCNGARVDVPASKTYTGTAQEAGIDALNECGGYAYSPEGPATVFIPRDVGLSVWANVGD